MQCRIGGGRMIFKRKDILASDESYNKNEFILWNSKHTSKDRFTTKKYSGKRTIET